MIICEKCFCDNEIKSIIKGAGKIGVCSICNSKNVYIYDTKKDNYLETLFDEFLNIYTPANLLPKHISSRSRKLSNELVDNWNIFTSKEQNVVNNIIVEICHEKYKDNVDLFTLPVAIKEMYDHNYLVKHSLLKAGTWEDFVKALKIENRYHTHDINLKLFERLCSYMRKTYKKETVFYRCRISTEKGLQKNEMGAPPTDSTLDGRANAKGVRCLYLGDSVETTIYEARTGAYDYVTVGNKKIKKDITVVDLKMINQISPFIVDFDSLEYAINMEHLNKINTEMGKIMRSTDSTLDYVPTQYITDFIKSIKHDNECEYYGIEYQSAMFKNGYNLAIFYPDLFECVDVHVYSIDTIDYKKHIIK